MTFLDFIALFAIGMTVVWGLVWFMFRFAPNVAASWFGKLDEDDTYSALDVRDGLGCRETYGEFVCHRATNHDGPHVDPYAGTAWHPASWGGAA